MAPKTSRKRCLHLDGNSTSEEFSGEKNKNKNISKTQYE